MSNSIEFFQTVMGKRFFEGTMPSIARSLETIARALEAQPLPKNGLVLIRDGVLTVIREDVPEDEEILFGSDYIARKLWTEEDVAMCLKNEGYAGSDEEVSAVINQGVGGLNDCTDDDWDVIYCAINRAELAGEIRKEEEDEHDQDP